MCRICVFAGTSEGRRLVEFLGGSGAEVCACVATDYGEALLPRQGNVEVHTGRLDEKAMEALFRDRGFDLIVDATHPFATQASGFIAAACDAAGVEYLRLNREEADRDAEAIRVGTMEEAAEYLADHPGNALLTTGSKALRPFAALEGFGERFYVRVLPMAASLEACAEAGFPPSHIIAMQGPFSVELNAAMLESVHATYLVTKDSGESGGLREKLEAARMARAKCIVIGRPVQPPGLGFDEVVHRLTERFHLGARREIAVVGIGMGAPETLTFEADAALRRSDCVIGAPRMLESVSRYGKPAFAEINPAQIVARMDEHPEYRRFAVVMSGDTGFYSGARGLLPLLAGNAVRVIPGLSTMQALCARLGTSWDDAGTVSLHGRSGSVVPALRRCGKVFVLLDGTDAIRQICDDLIDAGMGQTTVCIGERLSYPDERVTRGTAQELKDSTCAPLSAALLEHPTENRPLPVGLPDDAFIRRTGDGNTPAVPMTKSEVRALAISRLRLTRDAVVWDIGAGTGSISVEAALNCAQGRIYAVECRADAAALIGQNARRFALRNLTVVCGRAPEALDGLPAPTHAFIGGSSGNMKEIVAAVLSRNPCARIVATAVTPETAGELASVLQKEEFDDGEFIQLSVARGRMVGRHHLMTGMNPVWIAAMQRREGAKDDDQA